MEIAMKIKLFFALLISLIAAPLSAHVVAGSIWYKTVNGKKCTVYLLADYHDCFYLAKDLYQKTNGCKNINIPEWEPGLAKLKQYIAIEHQQTEMLHRYIQSRNQNSTLILLEGSKTDSFAAYFQPFLSEDNRKEVFAVIFNRINRYCSSTERRFIDPRFADDGTSIYYSFLNEFKFPMPSDNELLNSLLNKISDDTRITSRAFDNIANFHRTNKKFVKYATHAKEKYEKEIAAFCTHIQDPKMRTDKKYYDDTITRYILIYASLLDINAMHYLLELENNPKEHVFICIGDYHRQGMNGVLGELGYTLERTIASQIAVKPIHIHDTHHECEPLDMASFFRAEFLRNPPERQPNNVVQERPLAPQPMLPPARPAARVEKPQQPPVVSKPAQSSDGNKQRHKPTQPRANKAQPHSSFATHAKSIGMLCLFTSASLAFYSYLCTQKTPPTSSSPLLNAITLGLGVFGLAGLCFGSIISS
jgi:hypothetical protein